MPRSQRPLELHISALSPQEFSSYTAALDELGSDQSSAGSWLEKHVPVWEARGWLRGRYGLEASVVDTILKCFHPTLGSKDTLSSSQFFAALRLVAHAQAGREIDKSLVFVQASLAPSPRDKPRGLEHDGVFSDPSTAESALMASRQQRRYASEPHPDTPGDLPLPPAHLSTVNPFRRSTSVVSSTLSAPSIQDPPTTDRPGTGTDPSSLKFSTVNPFNSGTPIAQSQSTSSTASPPLPPRKPPLPPRSDSSNQQPPPRHPNQSTAHATSTLMKQSLIAAKGAQAIKALEVNLEKKRTWEVIGRSKGTTNNADDPSPGAGYKSVHSTPAKDSPPIPRAKPKFPSPPPSSASTSSLELVATARLPSRSPSPRRPQFPVNQSPFFDSDSSTALDWRIQKNGAGIARPSRSRSVHSLTPPPLPPCPPPPPRRRPESVQVLPSAVKGLSSPVRPSQTSKTNMTLSRHASLQRSATTPVPAERGAAALHTLYTSVRKRAEELETVRLKAEGKLVPGGFTRAGAEGERLVGHSSLEDSDENAGVGSDDEERMNFGRSRTTPPPYEAPDGRGWAPLGG
ncbi:hypothetical protein BOTBODRAFT_615393 [Botryobasidium botryosum FD-172 SS1]|uniref:Uncharacterized protein n=1 Tax=Botryobasidium botryosum (strain FD-172 SS1) TaxID=930990 RepID=A0A067LXU4_BOTB1|nr:hypothetical protein BOTBODRAFT_615393 [Botryobasidium botryosum FD-172 SS1]